MAGSPKVSRRAVAVAAILLAAIIWSTSFALTKITLAQLPPMTIGALRFVVAALILGVVVRARGDFAPPTVRQRITIAAAGLLGITLYFALENVGVQWASASDATLIVAAYPVIALALELALRRASFSVIRLAGMVIAIAGVALIVRNGSQQAGTHRLLGDLVLVAGGLVWAAYNLATQRDRSGASALVVTYYQTIAGAGGFVLLSLFEVRHWALPSGGNLLRLGYLAVLCSVVAFALYNFGLERVPSSVAVNLLNIVPVAGLVWAVVLAGESVGPLQLVGGAIVIIGVAIGLKKQPRTQQLEGDLADGESSGRQVRDRGQRATTGRTRG
ncbi:MAG TPA: DMT family transporter [Pseudonocardiaceae bacterium]|jgi:drug/metabolite transporter (DMT)-like permease|nr:DMT family transporter [Pseudonocardiaceae bacterium]